MSLAALVRRKKAMGSEVAYKIDEILNLPEKQRSCEERVDLHPVRLSQPLVYDKSDMFPTSASTHKHVPLLPVKWFHRGLDRGGAST